MKKPSLKPSVNLMLDSGAFSAWRSGRVIDIGAYADFLLTCREKLFCYVNLDVLPGKFREGKPSAALVEETAAKSWKNYQYLRKRGLEPMLVFHRGERFYWLEKMIGEGVQYVGLGGVAMGAGFKERRRWLDQTFTFLCGDCGWPPVKLHGFGIASLQLMFRYPWYTVDSTTWRTPSLYGKVLVPRPGPDAVLGDHAYEHAIQVIVNSSARVSEFGSCHGLYNKMGKQTAEYVVNYFNSLGVDFLVERESNLGRRRMLVRYFKAAMKQHKSKPFVGSDDGGFFGGVNKVALATTTEFIPKRTRFFFGIGPLKEDCELFLEEGVCDRLTAYPMVQRVSRKCLFGFIDTGIVEEA